MVKLMAELKTKRNKASVSTFLKKFEADRYRDCEIIIDLMTEATGEEAEMWGSAIIGFGSYHSAGVQFVRADGSVTRLHRDTDLQIRVYLGMADKDDLIPEFDPAAIRTRLEAEPLNPK